MTLHILVSSQIGAKDVGRLIGRGGATIKDLRLKSECQIEVANEGDFAADVYVFGKTQVNRFFVSLFQSVSIEHL